MRIGLWVVIVGAIVGLASLLLPGAPDVVQEPPSEPAPTTDDEPTAEEPSSEAEPDAKLQNRLAELAQADDPQAYASRHDLTYENGKVQVVVELGDQADKATFNWAVGALDGQVETSYESRVQVRVPRSALMKLARHPHVTFIRAPVRPQR